MGNYRQHLTFSSVLGGVYAWVAYILGGIHWVYGSVAALLTTISGLLPDLDHPMGVELRGLTGILGVLASVAVWHRVGRHEPDLAFEVHLWCVVLTFLGVRYGLRRTLARLMVHRGISHSLPTCAAWGAATFLYYPSSYPVIRAMMAMAVVLGFFSHLVLDEMFSVNLHGARVKASFGTAIKLWAPSPWATLGMYALLSYLSWRVIQQWPEGSLSDLLAEHVEPVKVPWPASWGGRGEVPATKVKLP